MPHVLPPDALAVAFGVALRLGGAVDAAGLAGMSWWSEPPSACPAPPDRNQLIMALRTACATCVPVTSLWSLMNASALRLATRRGVNW